MVETCLVRYVFLDVVRFTQGRSVEAQTEIVETLGSIVENATADLGISADKVILLPTGDGICIAILDSHQFDIHARLALDVLARVYKHNQQADDEMRRFEVRIGINENVDNLVKDVNGRPNVAGSGINLAQRIMNLADGSQILMGQAVHNVLSPREKYMKCLRPFSGVDKHGERFPVCQLCLAGATGLDCTQPSAFIRETPSAPAMTRTLAYYISIALRLREFVVGHLEDPHLNFVLPILIWHMAEDCIARENSSPYATPTRKVETSFDEAYKSYCKAPPWVLLEARNAIIAKHLSPHSSAFERQDANAVWYAPTESAELDVVAKFPDLRLDH